ncbi:ABC_transporter family protein [Hexamita inflata]|uniref:ABC_transporter family protein n=1 Tax=Hexamita inflata TaxID=28002 RepID=A0ABP1GDA2_9EUKA
MIENSDYQIETNQHGSSELKNITKQVFDQQFSIGIVVDVFSNKIFSGAFVLSVVSFAFLTANSLITKQSIQIVIMAMPLAVSEQFGILQTFQFMVLISQSFIIMNPQSYYEQYARARIDGRKDVISFAGLSKIQWHLSWNTLAAISIFLQITIIIVIGCILNFQFCSAQSLAIYIPTFLLTSLEVTAICDIIQHFCKTIQTFQQIFNVCSLLIFFAPALAAGMFIDSIQKYYLAVFSFLPSFPLMNAIDAGFNLGYFNGTLNNIIVTRNYIILQWGLQIIYTIIYSLIALKLDNSIVKSKSDIDFNVKQPEPTGKQLQSKVYNFGIENMTQQVKEQYQVLKKSMNNQLVVGSEDAFDLLPIQRPVPSPIIIYNVSKTFKSKDRNIIANSNINLLINPRTIFGLLGPNGSGKTTLCKALMMAHSLDSGDILLENTSIRSKTLNIQKGVIGICLQNDAALFDELTVQEHIDFYSQICYKKSGINVIQQFQLTEHVNKRAKELSGGWKRRLTIACTLVNDPNILILDEITSGVDAVAREEIWRLIKNICKDKTIIATTHTLHEAQAHFDNIGFIVSGRIVCCGTVDQINKLYENKICVELRGFLNEEFFQRTFQKGIKIQNEQNEKLSVQSLEAECVENNVDELFEELLRQQEIGFIETFQLSQRQFDQVFYELIRVCE